NGRRHRSVRRTNAVPLASFRAWPATRLPRAPSLPFRGLAWPAPTPHRALCARRPPAPVEVSDSAVTLRLAPRVPCPLPLPAAAARAAVRQSPAFARRPLRSHHARKEYAATMHVLLPRTPLAAPSPAQLERQHPLPPGNACALAPPERGSLRDLRMFAHKGQERRARPAARLSNAFVR